MVVKDPAINDTFFILNPETVLKVNLTSPEELVENLYIRKRFEEASKLSNNTYGKPMVDKIQSAYFNDLISTDQIDMAKSLIVQYFGNDRDKWIHWLTKIMQKKKLQEFIELIPTESGMGDQKLPGV